MCACTCETESVCGPVNPCYGAVSVSLFLRVNIGLTTCNDILSYACLTHKEPHPLPISEQVCVRLPFIQLSLVSLLYQLGLWLLFRSIVLHRAHSLLLHLSFSSSFHAFRHPNHPSRSLFSPPFLFDSVSASPWPSGVTYITAQLAACLDFHN